VVVNKHLKMVGGRETVNGFDEILNVEKEV